MKMTKEQALALKSFDHYCTCGGFAHSMNARDPRRPHMDWCPQKEQYNAWFDAMNQPAAPGGE